MSRTVLLIAIAMAALASTAHPQAPGGTIGVYADSLGVSNSIPVVPFMQTQFYVLARPHLANTGGGISAASFRVKYTPPPDLLVTATASPLSTVASITPFRDESLPGPRGGAIIVWGDGCVGPGSTGMILLYTATALALAPVSDVLLEVDRFDDPIEPPYPEIRSCLIGGNVFRLEVDGLHAVINGTTVPVVDRRWGAVKRLFR